MIKKLKEVKSKLIKLKYRMEKKKLDEIISETDNNITLSYCNGRMIRFLKK